MKELFVTVGDQGIVNKRQVREAFNLPAGRYLVKIESKNKRTSPQNNYYWGCLLPLVRDGLKDIGYADVKSKNDAHEILKHLFLKKHIENKDTGEVITIAGSTSDLTTIQFNEYLEEIWMWAAHYLSIVIPSPNEQISIWHETN